MRTRNKKEDRDVNETVLLPEWLPHDSSLCGRAVLFLYFVFEYFFLEFCLLAQWASSHARAHIIAIY